MNTILAIILIVIIIVALVALAWTFASNVINTMNTGSMVSISGQAFNPNSITVAVGTTVIWKNNDGMTHTVTSDSVVSNNFSSGNLLPGQSYTYIFDTAGTYNYHCSIHPTMHGTVIVQ